MKKKGFTLIELLAVIVILAIIALIAVPIVLNMIDSARKSGAKSSALGFIDAIEYNNGFAEAGQAGYTKIGDGEFEVDEIIGLKMKGKLPSNGTVVIENGKVVSATDLCIEGYKVSYQNKDITSVVKGCEAKEQPTKEYVCKRATILHTEECNFPSGYYFCIGAGYTTTGSKGTTTITYGNLGTTGKLASGDAFDCDVNGNGKYDDDFNNDGISDERFYYVSDYYDTNLKTFDTTKAVLIYYNNTKDGVANNTEERKIAYDSSGGITNGPVTAETNLPSTIQWSNSKIIVPGTRKILNQDGTEVGSHTYTDKAARMLTVKEIETSCNVKDSITTDNVLANCEYLFENIGFSSPSSITYYWLETPSNYSNFVLQPYSYSRRLTSGNGKYSTYGGVRPAIDVLKTDIDY